MTIGQRIMQIRAIAGMSQEEFGEKLGTSRQTVSKWELDITVPEYHFINGKPPRGTNPRGECI